MRARVTTGVLDAILARTRARVERERSLHPLQTVRAEAGRAPAVRPFGAALARPDRIGVIAEHKRRSPSRGAIREDLAPAAVARAYAAAAGEIGRAHV